MNHFLRRGICLGAWVAGCGMAHAQLAAVKTNALLWGNLTPNISMELVTASKFSLEGTVFYGLNTYSEAYPFTFRQLIRV